MRQILISPLKNLNYHDGNRKVIQQLSLSASRWASARHGASGAAAQGAISATYLTTEEQTFRGVRLTLRNKVLAFFFWGHGRLWKWLCVGASPGKEGSRSRALLHSWTRRLFASRCPGWQRSWIGASEVNGRENVPGDSRNRKAWGLKICSLGNLIVEACQTLHLPGSCAALQQSQLALHTSAGKGHA